MFFCMQEKGRDSESLARQAEIMDNAALTVDVSSVAATSAAFERTPSPVSTNVLTDTLYKKLSYRKETARQLPTWRGLGAHSPSAPSGYTYVYGRIRKPQRTYVKRAVH